jgi:hypothetical protein
MNPVDARIQEDVDRLFDRFERMTDAAFLMLRSEWEGGDATAREEAWTMVKAGLKTNRRDSMLDDARNRIAAWVNNYAPATAVGWHAGQANFTGSGMDAASIRKAAIPPMLDAIAATIAADSLDQDQRWALLKPYDAINQ